MSLIISNYVRVLIKSSDTILGVVSDAVKISDNEYILLTYYY